MNPDEQQAKLAKAILTLVEEHSASAAKPDESPWKEIGVLEEIIARHETHAMKVKGWLFLLLTSASAGRIFVGDFRHSPYFMTFVILASLVFVLWELFHRGLVRLAIERVATIEENMRNQAHYDGPRVVVSLSPNLTIRKAFSEIRDPWNWWSVIATALWLSLLWFWTSIPSEVSESVGPGA